MHIFISAEILDLDIPVLSVIPSLLPRDHASDLAMACSGAIISDIQTTNLLEDFDLV